MALQDYFNGKVYTQPGSGTQINTSALNPLQLGYSGITAVLGSCVSGQPMTPLMFTSPGQLAAALGSGPAYDAARVTFTPTTQIVEGNSVRPQIVYVVRTDTATQTVFTAKDSSNNPTLTFTSLDYGVQTNNIQIVIASASHPTYSPLVTVPSGISFPSISITDSFTNASEQYGSLTAGLGQYPLITLQYTDSGACTVTVNATCCPGSQPGIAIVATGGSVPFTIYVPFATYQTIGQIVDYIQQQISALTIALAVSYYVAAGTGASTLPATAFDYFTASVTSSPTTGLFGTVYAVQQAINGVSGTVSVALAASSSNLSPAASAGLVPTTAGVTTPASNAGQITAALNTLTHTRINFLTGAFDADPTIQGFDTGLAFATFLENMQGQNECRGHLGLSANITQAAGAAYIAQVNCPFLNLYFQGPIMPNALGVTTTYSPWMTAAMAAGMQAGMPVGSSFVQKSLNIIGLSYNTSSFDIVNNADQIILQRFSLLRYNGATQTYNFVRCLSAYVSDANSFNIEPGIQCAVNYAVYNIRQDIEQKFLGARTLFTEAGSTADSISRELVAYGALLQANNIIIPGTILQNNQIVTLPALVIDSITITNDTARLRYGIRPIGSINFIFHTVNLNAVTQVATS